MKIASETSALILWCVAFWSSIGNMRHTRAYKIGLIQGNSDFFAPVEDGWKFMCEQMGQDCLFLMRNDTNDEECIAIVDPVIEQWLDEGIQGIAMKPACGALYSDPLIENLMAQGVPVVTFDSRSEKAAAYVGTNQEFLGRTMARLLRQLRPEGGTYAMVARKTERDEAFIAEIEKYNNRDDRAHWYELSENYTQAENVWCTSCLPEGGFLGVMERAVILEPDAMIFFKQSPMRDEGYPQFVREHFDKNITYIGTDGADYQLSYLDRRLVDGLVGQLPYEFGTKSVQALYDILATGGPKGNEGDYNTNIVAYNLIPVELPELDLDENLLGNLKWVGYTCFGFVAISVMVCCLWTYLSWGKVVVKAAQPFFLYMVAIGVFIMSSSLIPLSQDDGGEEKSESHTWSVGVCMSIPWLAFVGFTMSFSALFSKTWRVNRIFEANAQYTRVRVSPTDVMMPFFLLLGANILILVLWTVLDPLEYIRREHEGTDYWNRVISTYGACRSDNAVAYLVPLAVTNFISVLTACWQAIKARNIESEFAESKYISLAVASLLQGFLTGIPVVLLVRDEPQVYYVMLSSMIFLLSMALLWLIFLPKMLMQRKYDKLSPNEQREMLARSLRNPDAPSSQFNSASTSFPAGAGAYRSSNPGLEDSSAYASSIKRSHQTPIEEQDEMKPLPPSKPKGEHAGRNVIVPVGPSAISELTGLPEVDSDDSHELAGQKEEDKSNDTEPTPTTDAESDNTKTNVPSADKAEVSEAPNAEPRENDPHKYDEFRLGGSSMDDETTRRSSVILDDD